MNKNISILNTMLTLTDSLSISINDKSNLIYEIQSCIDLENIKTKQQLQADKAVREELSFNEDF